MDDPHRCRLGSTCAAPLRRIVRAAAAPVAAAGSAASASSIAAAAGGRQPRAAPAAGALSVGAWHLALDVIGGAGGAVDPLARDQLDVLVARHLLARYRLDAARPPPLALPIALAGATLRRVLAHVEAHMDADLRLAELAALAHLSEDHFLRAFKRAVGQTPHQYLIGCRLARARRLLAEGRLPVAEIGRRCGFRNPSHFAATFRRHEGQAPAAWARRH
jgi:AraC family transcriptional regulator